jgi:uncharacterized membrane protein YdbT with pleckstrin-like domain
MEKLHPGAKWKFRIGGYVGLFFLLAFFAMPMLFAGTVSGIEFGGLLIFLLLGIVFVIAVIEVATHLTYINWKYEFTRDSLKIEKGVIVKRYKSIPYERIQNVDITRGIVARIVGFSTVDIQTAGYSGGYQARGQVGVSEGHIPAVSIEGAEKIREFLMHKISHKKTSGL